MAKDFPMNEVETVSTSSDVQRFVWNDTQDEEFTEALNFHLLDKLKIMIQRGAPILFDKTDRSPMEIAAIHSRADIIEIILERYKNGNHEVDKFKAQASEALLKTCVSNCGASALNLLQADGVEVPKFILNKAAKHGSTEVIDVVLAHGKNFSIDYRNEEGNTPLHSAIMNKHTRTVEFLLHKNADPNLSNPEGYTSVHFACIYAGESILRLLITNGADVNLQCHKGRTPTMTAALRGNHDCIHILAEAGANLDRKDESGNTPTIAAASEGRHIIVKELIINGAALGLSDNESFTALDWAILNRNDEAAAIIIRLTPDHDFIKYYLDNCRISWLKIFEYRLIETLKALLDRMLVQDTSNPQNVAVYSRYLEMDTHGKTPGDKNYNKNRFFFLERLARLGNEELAYHGTVRLSVDWKMEKFGNLLLVVQICTYAFFIFSLAYSLIQASYHNDPREVYTQGALNIIRIFTEIYVFVYFVLNTVVEAFELIREFRSTYRSLQDEKETNKLVDKQLNKIDKKCDQQSKRGFRNIIWFRVILSYSGNNSNYLDVLGLYTLLILFILRAASQPSQWIFATITFLLNSLRIFKLIAVVPGIGPYSTIIYKVLIKDVPLFSFLFSILLLIFTGTYFIALRTPYTPEGFSNASLMQSTGRVLGVDNSVQWVFLSGLRILIEGNVYEDQYLYRQLNWLAALVYIVFLFLTLVVLLNVFIAQLSDTYSKVYDIFKTYAWQRLNFIIQIETKSLLSYFRSKTNIGEVSIDEDEMFKYYNVNNIKKLNTKYLTEDIEVNEVLASIKNQQTVIHKQELQSRDAASEDIKELIKRMDGLVTEVKNMDRRIEQLTKALDRK